MNKRLFIGTRGSKLALWQAEHIKDELLKIDSSLEIGIKIIKTTGDKILDVPLAKIGGKGLFTKEIEEEMIKGEVDIAVHSLKDVPVEFPEGLVLSSITKRDDPRDCFISFKYASIDELPQNALVGTTSLRRVMQLKKYRKDLRTKSLRGNVQTRLKKLENGEFDAIILATAGVNRLDIWDCANYIKPIEVEIMIPAMGQAALGIECKEGSFAKEITSKLTDEITYIETKIERDFVKELEGGCQVPIGVYAKLNNNSIEAKAIIGTPDGVEMLEEHIFIDREDYKDGGKRLAELMIKRGARELLKRSEKMAAELLDL